MITRKHSNQKQRSFLIILLLFSIAISISSCGKSSNTNEPEPSVQDVEVEEEVTQPPLPLDLTQMIVQGVEQGEWTEGEGIVTALQILIGEAEPPGFAEISLGIDYHSGWGLSNIAHLFLESDAPKEEKKEVERLLNILAPSNEILEKFSVPARTSQSKTPGLAAIHNLQVDCTTLWHQGFESEDIFSPPMCLEYTDAPYISGGRARAYYPIDMAADGAVISAVINSLDAVTEAVAKYREFGLESRSINLIFTQLDMDAVTNAFVPTRSASDISSEPCPILIHPLGVAYNSNNANEFKQLIAHEVFHCLQYWRYGSLNTAVVSWWAEGTAVYFSNLVYPNTNGEYEYIGSFDGRSVDTPLTYPYMGYANFVFFMYVGETRGPGQVITMADSLTNRFGGGGVENSQASQLRTLSSFGGIGELFHEFAKDYMDRRITDTSGSRLPVNPQPGEVLQYPGGPSNIITSPFVVSRYQLLFEEENTFEIEKSTRGPSGKNNVRPSNEGDRWGTLPDTVNAACGPTIYKLVITSTSSSSSDEYALVLEIEDEEALECDDCLVGHWEMGTDVFEPFFSRQFNDIPDTNFVKLTGVFGLSIYPDGSFLYSPVDYTIHWRITEGGDETYNIMQLSGYTQGGYGIIEDEVTEEQKIRAWNTNIVFVGTLTQTRDGTTNTMSMPVDPGASGVGFEIPDSDYTCTGNTLTITVPDEAPISQHIYKRISLEPHPLPEGAIGAPAGTAP